MTTSATSPMSHPNRAPFSNQSLAQTGVRRTRSFSGAGAASALFAFYVTNFAGYAKTYGALGGVVVLLMWFYISSIVVLMGAEMNAELERQTVEDTTELRNAPLGQRGAFAADTVGPPASSGKAPTHDETGTRRAVGPNTGH